MNEMKNEIPGPEVRHQTGAESASSAQTTQQQCNCAFDPIRRALHQGAQDARAAATAAVPIVKRALAEAARQATYGAAYAVAFQITAVKLACPDVIKDGSCRGYDAGKAAAQQVAEMMRQRRARTTETAPETGSASAVIQPGLA